MLRQALAANDWLVAEGALRRLLLLGAASAEQLDLLAYVLLMQGRFADCEATLEQALAAGSRSFWTPHKLGDARRGQQRLEAAAAAYEQALLEYATHALQTIPGVRLIGTAPDKASVLSFVLAGYTTEAVGQALNAEGIAVRSGHHCAQPILRRFGLAATVRPSLAFYNTCAEVDHLIAVIRRLAATRF